MCDYFITYTSTIWTRRVFMGLNLLKPWAIFVSNIKRYVMPIRGPTDRDYDRSVCVGFDLVTQHDLTQCPKRIWFSGLHALTKCLNRIWSHGGERKREREKERVTTNTELSKKVCPRLRDLATAPAGGITQPKTNFFGQLCMSAKFLSKPFKTEYGPSLREKGLTRNLHGRSNTLSRMIFLNALVSSLLRWGCIFFPQWYMI